jgi:NAD(P)-dependent dehydrogenase (short-subunit alcohol dehydrogenase family)
MSPPKPTIALVTGANAGIGLATATLLARDHGFHVIIGSRNTAAGQEVAAKLSTEGLQASSVQLDLASDESLKAAVSWIEDKFGVLDCLINNAGILIDYVPGVTDESKDLSTRELFTKTLNTNLVGTACLTELCLPLLRKAELPRLIFVSSIVSQPYERLPDPLTTHFKCRHQS